MRVAIFRPDEYARETAKLLEREGFQVLHAPMIEVEEQDVEVEDADFTIITSQTSARIALRRGLVRGKVVAIGPKTAELLRERYEVAMPSKYDSSTLYREFRDVLAGKRVNLLRSDKGDPVLLKLSEVCDLREYVLYRIVPAFGERQRKAVEEVASGRVDAAVFSSRMIVRAFMENAKRAGLLEKVVKRLNEIVSVAIGPPTADELSKYGISAEMPEEYTFEGVIALLRSLRSP
ncbi:MAG: uroporphyrinogen-III synthase [Archaeoglobi archaeon]|nr:uroporphyrinogen-III synthase [Archaeoglobi archaeon]